MSGNEPSKANTPGGARMGRGFSAAITGFAGVGAIAALYVMGLSACKLPQQDAGLGALAHGAMAKLQVPQGAASYPDAAFADGAGKPVKLSDFKGKAVILNLWATWCAPCVKEMPTLAALQTAEAAKGVKVVALSTDAAGEGGKAKTFIAAHPPLTFYQDDKFAVPSAITPHIEGFPTTLLYDRA